MARGLTRHEAEAASAQLNLHGIAVSTSADSQKAERFQLAVAESAVAEAVAALTPRAQTLASDSVPARTIRKLPLVPTRSAEARAKEEELDARLRQLVRSVPGVVEIAVQSTIMPARDTLDDLSAAPRPAAIKLNVQLLREADSPALAERVRELITKRVPELARAAIAIDERALAPLSTRCAPLTHLGPITLTAASMSTLKLWLGTSLLVHMLSAAALLAMLRRGQRLRRSSVNAGSARD